MSTPFFNYPLPSKRITKISASEQLYVDNPLDIITMDGTLLIAVLQEFVT
jgi:hypothetical protein